MIEHLKKRSGDRHAIDTVDIISDMQQYFDKAARIPVFINMTESDQKRLLDPISPSQKTCWLP